MYAICFNVKYRNGACVCMCMYTSALLSVEDAVENVEVVSDVAAVDDDHEMTISADSGTNYICEWTVHTDPPDAFITNDTTAPLTGTVYRLTHLIFLPQMSPLPPSQVQYID